jgi:SAM-dependent methyltransferase
MHAAVMTEMNHHLRPAQAEWDERYAGMDRVWSGNPNGQLISEVQGLRPGRALDVGCGEGADALWLAAQGWDVTALDVSKVALDRAVAQADKVGATVHWLHAGLVEAELPPGSFDLVSAQYAVLIKTDDNRGERALLAAVAPGGVLLVVHHVIPKAGHDHSHDHGQPATPAQAQPAPSFKHEDYVFPADVAALLGDGWRMDVDETRPRHVTTGSGAGHTQDLVLRAVRLM